VSTADPANSSLWITLGPTTADPSGNAPAAANLSSVGGSGETSCVAVPYAQVRDTLGQAEAALDPLEIDGSSAAVR